MSLLAYHIFLRLYTLAIRILAFFQPKAKLWWKGRKDIFHLLAQKIQTPKKRIWVHCASLGEFEQARPVIEALKLNLPDYAIILSFFSPSGYEIRKNYEGADYVVYLPMDGKSNAARFISIVKPEFAIMVKYEFWYYYLTTLKKQNIPVYLISAAFRESQPFFAWYGGLFRKMLRCFDTLFVQDRHSADLLLNLGMQNVVHAGDTRYDRVTGIARAAVEIPIVEKFKGNAPLLIAGSTWPKDEQVLRDAIHALPEHWKIILAPHEITNTHLDHIRLLFEPECVCYTRFEETYTQQRILIIDNIGMLASIYRYGDIAYVGGGFLRGGIHNVLEPAVFGLPIIFGPNYEKFTEACDLLKQGFAFPITDAAQCKEILTRLTELPDEVRHQNQIHLQNYIREQEGATEKVLRVILHKHIYQQPVSR